MRLAELLPLTRKCSDGDYEVYGHHARTWDHRHALPWTRWILRTTDRKLPDVEVIFKMTKAPPYRWTDKNRWGHGE